jgi:Sulfotransferase family
MFHIVGAGRSGTSLVAGLLDAHPDCEVALERYSEMLMTRDDRERRLDDYLRACKNDALASRKPLWGHKTTTEQIFWFGDAPLFLSRTNDIPVVFMLRDARTCIPSKIRRTGQPLDRAINSWRFGVHLWKTMRSSGHALLTVRMEDLVRNPEPVLSQACDFLGLTFSPLMLHGTANVAIPEPYRRDFFDTSVVTLPASNPPWFSQVAAELREAGYL